jgi:hypothetical protein
VWHLDIFEDGHALLAISFFSWLIFSLSVHALLLWHTFKVKKKSRVNEIGGMNNEHTNEAPSDRVGIDEGLSREPSLWKAIAWTKIFITTLAHLLSLYFVIVCIGATSQQDVAREKLPYVQEAIYDHMNEGPVCAFDNKGPESNIITFPQAQAAHSAGFLILHCG